MSSQLKTSPQETLLQGTSASQSKSASMEDELKALLFADEQVAISDLRSGFEGLRVKIDDPEIFKSIVANSLVQALNEAGEDDRVQMIDTLAHLISPPVRFEIRKAQPEILEALYPVADELVAKGVKNAMEKMQADLNQQMAAKFSFFDRLKPRARHSQEMLVKANFDVKAVYLVHRETGLMIAGADRDESAELEVGLASLVTAIGGLAQDVFSPGAASDLRTIETETARLLIESSPMLTMVAIVEGPMPTETPFKFSRLFGEFQKAHAQTFAAFNGQIDMVTKDDIERALEKVRLELGVDDVAVAKQSKRRKFIFLAVSGLVALGLCFIIGRWWIGSSMVARGDTVIESSGEAAAYPVRLNYRQRTGVLEVRGLVKDKAMIDSLTDSFIKEFGRGRIDLRLAPISP